MYIYVLGLLNTVLYFSWASRHPNSSYHLWAFSQLGLVYQHNTQNIWARVTRAYFWNCGNFWCNCGKKLWKFFGPNCGKNMWKFILKSRFSPISYHKIRKISLFLHMGMSNLGPILMIFWKIWEFLIISKIFWGYISHPTIFTFHYIFITKYFW